MTEKEALIKLGAKDWRSLNKNQIMSFLFDVAPNLSDEIRLRVLELAPDILNTANTIMSELQETTREILEQNHDVVDKILTQNHDIAGAIAASYHEAFETLRKLISSPDATFEEKQYWNSELFKQLREFREYDKGNKDFLIELDTKNKNFSAKLLQYGLYAGIFVFGVAIASFTGGKFKLNGK